MFAVCEKHVCLLSVGSMYVCCLCEACMPAVIMAHHAELLAESTVLACCTAVGMQQAYHGMLGGSLAVTARYVLMVLEPVQC